VKHTISHDGRRGGAGITAATAGGARAGPRGTLHEPLQAASRERAPAGRGREAGWRRLYDAVIIGGGHNGLVSAAYLARAGLKTLVLERRHVLGGAAVTEEIVPGFRFSMFSYVVSLLRPEIIRDLELPKHGLDILPLDGTFTPLRKGEGPKASGGDYLWRVNDHGRTVRELRRWSKNDAEAYEEYGQLMVEMARFIKPILGIVPATRRRWIRGH
jgi:phytoene dehydrogenase-like protein